MNKIILLKMNEMIRIQSELLAIIAKQEQKNLSRPLHENLLDAQDVMQILHISPRTLFRYRKKGTLPYQKVEGKIFYTKDDIDQLLNII